MKSKSSAKSDNKYELSRAQAFYTQNNPCTMQSRAEDAARPIIPYTPYLNGDPSWRFYAVNQNDTLLAVDVDMTDRITQDYVFLKNWEAYQQTHDANYLRSYTRYVYTLNRKTGEEQAFYMTIIPTKGFVGKHIRRIRGITYLKRDEAFSGMILYHGLDGDFVNGWRYDHGKITGQILPESRAFLCAPNQKTKDLILARHKATYRVALKLDRLSRADMDMDEDQEEDDGDLPDTDADRNDGGGHDNNGSDSGNDTDIDTDGDFGGNGNEGDGQDGGSILDGNHWLDEVEVIGQRSKESTSKCNITKYF